MENVSDPKNYGFAKSYTHTQEGKLPSDEIRIGGNKLSATNEPQRVWSLVKWLSTF